MGEMKKKMKRKKMMMVVMRMMMMMEEGGGGREAETQRRREGGGWMQVTVEVGTRFVIHRDRRRGREATMRHSVSAIGLRIFSAFQEF